MYVVEIELLRNRNCYLISLGSYVIDFRMRLHLLYGGKFVIGGIFYCTIIACFFIDLRLRTTWLVITVNCLQAI